MQLLDEQLGGQKDVDSSEDADVEWDSEVELDMEPMEGYTDDDLEDADEVTEGKSEVLYPNCRVSSSCVADLRRETLNLSQPIRNKIPVRLQVEEPDAEERDGKKKAAEDAERRRKEAERMLKRRRSSTKCRA